MTQKKIKSNRKKRRYVVGFDADHQVVYGSPGTGTGADFVAYFRPMTLFSAQRELRKLNSGRNPVRAAIYELVPVHVVTVKGFQSPK